MSPHSNTQNGAWPRANIRKCWLLIFKECLCLEQLPRGGQDISSGSILADLVALGILPAPCTPSLWLGPAYTTTCVGGTLFLQLCIFRTWHVTWHMVDTW